MTECGGFLSLFMFSEGGVGVRLFCWRGCFGGNAGEGQLTGFGNFGRLLFQWKPVSLV